MGLLCVNCRVAFAAVAVKAKGLKIVQGVGATSGYRRDMVNFEPHTKT